MDDSFQTQILPKMLPVMHIFSFAIMTYLKKLTGTKSLNREQCPAGLSPRIIPSLPVSLFLPKYSKTGFPSLNKGNEGWNSA